MAPSSGRAFLLSTLVVLVTFAPLAAAADSPLLLLERKLTPTTCSTRVRATPPPYAVCHEQGSVSSPAPIETTVAKSVAICRDRCLNNPHQCISFSYGPKTTCITYSKTIRSSDLKRGPTGRTFWNHRCFSRKCGLCPGSLSPCRGFCFDLQNDGSHCGNCNAVCHNKKCQSGSCVCLNGDAPSLCHNSCPDYQTDDNNCGSCGHVCQNGTLCLEGDCACRSGELGDDDNCGTCGNVCTQGTTCSTDGNCVCSSGQLGDDNNCGTCGNACTQGTTCSTDGKCVCSSGQLGDDNNCGTCGNACTQGTTCSTDGKCVCSSGQLGDDNNCGTCGNVCTQGTSCSADGKCVCSSGQLGDDNNCGTCGNVCSSGSSCQSGSCKCPDGALASTLQSNNNDCGQCGNICQFSSTCQSGTCKCADGSLVSTLQSNNNDCGQCGNKCLSGSTCQSGACKCADGALASALQTNNNDCGTCGNKCLSGSTCQSGACECADGSLVSSLQTNVNDCGTCGNKCIGSGASCSAGQCTCSDASKTYCPQVGCISTVSFNYDSKNCGGCGRACGSNQICSQGGCIADPGSCNNRGVQWAYLTNIDGENQDDTYANFKPEHYSSGKPILHNGQIQQIGSWTQNSNTIYDSGLSAGATYYVMNHRGYIFAPLSGSYTVTFGLFNDDITCFWLGTSAYSGYTRANAVICRGAGPDGFSGPHTASVTMAAGNYYAFRVMYSNAQGNVYFTFGISHDSSGLSVINGNANSANPWVIQQGCNGAPAAFKPFGSEN